MDNPSSDKLTKLFSMLERQPSDTFLLYGIGMEYKKLDDLPRAIEYFNKVLAVDPGYCYAYYQRAQVQEQAGDVPAAKASYQEGIAAAERVGDAHARSELDGALQMLEM
jgi:tetratricopeptide (TPR) repeat protein